MTSPAPVLLVEPGTEFTGRRAVVTGGTRGIGRAIADRLRAGGASVLVAARTAPEGRKVVLQQGADLLPDPPPRRAARPACFKQ